MPGNMFRYVSDNISMDYSKDNGEEKEKEGGGGASSAEWGGNVPSPSSIAPECAT